jgi:MFS family permease
VSFVDVSRVQRRSLALLVCTQTIGGIGVAIGITVGALLAADLGGSAASGLASSAAVIGGGVLAVPATRLMRVGGRRPGLVFAYLVGALGAIIVVLGAGMESLPVVVLGTVLFGGGSTANLQARYAAVDLATPATRGRQLSIVVAATTIGAVSGPNVAAFADRAVRGWGIREYAGPFAFSALAFAVAAGVIFVLMRPDPLRVAREVAASVGAAPVGGAGVGDVAGAARVGGKPPARTDGLRVGWRAVSVSPAARLGMAAVAVAHLVMVGVMSMTPVHLGHGITDHARVLTVVGFVLSMHIVGMYAFAPVMGWLTDRLGRRPVIIIGVGLLLAACAVAGTAGYHTARLTVGLFLLGLGWSAATVAGSTLLSESVDLAVRPAAQGLNDLVMGIAGASAGALSGVVLQFGGYPTLALIAAIAALPLLAQAARTRPVPATAR